MSGNANPANCRVVMVEQAAREFATSHWGDEWPVSKIEEFTGWSSWDICRFRREEPDTYQYDFSEYAPASVFMERYDYKRTAFRSLIYNARRRLEAQGKTLRTKLGKSPHSYQNVIYYNIEDVLSVSTALKGKSLHYGLVGGLKKYLTGEVPLDLTKDEHTILLALVVWYIKHPYGPAPSMRRLEKVVGVSFSSIGLRIRSLIKKKYIDRRIRMDGGKKRGKKVEYRFLKPPTLLEVHLVRANPFLVEPFSKTTERRSA